MISSSSAACAVVYKEDTGTKTVKGLWSYNDESRKVLILFEVVEGGVVVETYLSEYHVEVQDGKLELKAYIGNGGYVRGVFKPSL